MRPLRSTMAMMASLLADAAAARFSSVSTSPAVSVCGAGVTVVPGGRAARRRLPGLGNTTSVGITLYRSFVPPSPLNVFALRPAEQGVAAGAGEERRRAAAGDQLVVAAPAVDHRRLVQLRVDDHHVVAAVGVHRDGGDGGRVEHPDLHRPVEDADRRPVGDDADAVVARRTGDGEGAGHERRRGRHGPVLQRLAAQGGAPLGASEVGGVHGRARVSGNCPCPLNRPAAVPISTDLPA